MKADLFEDISIVSKGVSDKDVVVAGSCFLEAACRSSTNHENAGQRKRNSLPELVFAVEGDHCPNYLGCDPLILDSTTVQSKTKTGECKLSTCIVWECFETRK